jgi:predicted nucleotidyltransferase
VKAIFVGRSAEPLYDPVMTRQDAIAVLKQEASALKALGATGLYLFGSTARDFAGSESDLDLFIDYDSGSRFSFVELVGIKQLLEGRLGVQVDVTTRDSLDPLLKDQIEASAERVF